jgi:hypothetical protein
VAIIKGKNLLSVENKGFYYSDIIRPERKIFRRICGFKYEDEEWKIRTNRELEKLNKGENNSKMDKGTKYKLVGSPVDNGGG